MGVSPGGSAETDQLSLVCTVGQEGSFGSDLKGSWWIVDRVERSVHPRKETEDGLLYVLLPPNLGGPLGCGGVSTKVLRRLLG